MKKIFSLLCASVMAVSILTTAVSAMDYAEPDKATFPQKTEDLQTTGMAVGTITEVETDATGETKTETPAAKVVTRALIEEAIEKGEAIPVSKSSAVVSKSAIAAMKESGEPVKFVAKNCLVTIDPATIEDGAVIDVSLKVTSPKKDTRIMNVPVPAGAKVIKPNTKKALGCTMSITVNLGNMDVSKANVYAIYATGKVVNLGPVVNSGNGTATIEISKNCAYIISDKAIG